MTGFERHLLGWDEPTLREVAAELSQASVKAMSMRAESDKIGENCETDASDTSESSKCRESCETGRITDELRKFATDPLLGYASQELHVERITAIADRIDEQFNRICWQQEAVLQSTIDTMVDERDKLRTMLTEQRDEAMAKVLKLDSEASELQKKLDEYKSLFERYRDSYVQYVGEYNVLQRALRRIAKRAGVPDEVDLSECDNALLHKLTIEHIDSMHEYIGALEWQRDRQRKLLDEYENADTPEEIVRDIHLGIATDSQAIERIRALNG